MDIELEADRPRRLLAAIVESSDDAIISKDLDGTILSWNKGAERIFGYSPEEAIGQPILILIPEGREGEEYDILARIRRGEMVDHFETVRRHKSGALLDISVTISPIRNAHGKIIGASKIARDVTTQRAAQRKLKALTAELERSKLELETRVEERTASLKAAVSQMEEFSYTVSHDLRAPLRAMTTYARALLEDFGPLLKDEPDAICYLGRILANGQRLDHMIRDVLTFGRVAKDGVVLEPVNVDDVVRNIVQLYPSLQPPEAAITVGSIGSVIAHEPSLIQALSNLLLNAVKFVEPGIKPVVRVFGEDAGRVTRIVVSDNGIGIAPRYQRRLFELFERFHQDRGFEGTGVGLAIVRKATLRMGGRVGAESDGTHGSRFWIELGKVPA